MQRILKNQYKRQDIFRCSHKAHYKFEKNVSVYHVLLEKKCFPQGCLYFFWKCRLLNKGRSCPKGFEHVGRKCFGCKEYYEEKVCYQPELLLKQNEFEKFKNSLEEYEEWLGEVSGRDVEFSGEINSIKPLLKKTIYPRGTSLKFKGFLLNFKNGWINRVFLDDYLYAWVSVGVQKKQNFSKGDKLDFKARLLIDRGRIVLGKVRYVEFSEKTDKLSWDLSEALVAKSTGTELDCQPERCLACEKGCLLDVVDKSAHTEKAYRHLFCLAGIKDPENCVYDLKKKLEMEKVEKEE